MNSSDLLVKSGLGLAKFALPHCPRHPAQGPATAQTHCPIRHCTHSRQLEYVHLSWIFSSDHRTRSHFDI